MPLSLCALGTDFLCWLRHDLLEDQAKLEFFQARCGERQRLCSRDSPYEESYISDVSCVCSWGRDVWSLAVCGGLWPACCRKAVEFHGFLALVWNSDSTPSPGADYYVSYFWDGAKSEKKKQPPCYRAKCQCFGDESSMNPLQFLGDSWRFRRRTYYAKNHVTPKPSKLK